MYTVGQQHGTGTSSTIKTTIDNWYKTTTLETDAATKTLVADQIFCNDRTVTSGTWVSTGSNFDYAPIDRIFDNSPSLKCINESDKFTVNSSNGNGALIYPVGLITTDEINMAGGGSTNSSYYLYTNQYYWLGSPYKWSGSGANSFFVDVSGSLGLEGVNFVGARPVISLSSKAKLSGSGTYNDVYTLS